MGTVAFIGTGIMGGHMARRLAQAGHRVHAWNRTPAKARSLSGFGVHAMDCARAAADGASQVVVMLSDADAVESVLFEPDATGTSAADHIAAGSLLIVSTSMPVEAARDQASRLAAKSIRYVDAPVSGGERGAREGELAIMAGGDPIDVEEARTLFAPLGKLTRTGAVGSGQLTKLANQIVVAGTLLAVAEALSFAGAGGADIASVRQVLEGGFSDSAILRQHGERMVRGDYVPGSPSHQQRTNLRNAAAQAQAMGIRLELLPLAENIFSSMVDSGRGDLDIAAVYQQVIERSHARRAS